MGILWILWKLFAILFTVLAIGFVLALVGILSDFEEFRKRVGRRQAGIRLVLVCLALVICAIWAVELWLR
jgi:uncharacterized membrane protein HdeD (DUF308 family)